MFEIFLGVFAALVLVEAIKDFRFQMQRAAMMGHFEELHKEFQEALKEVQEEHETKKSKKRK